jgi:cytochrome c5
MKASLVLCAAVALVCAGCNARLPDPQSPGAQLYAHRCNTCHRLYAPSSMTYAMWQMQLKRMQGEMLRRGIPPLTTAQSTVILDYLRHHSE